MAQKDLSWLEEESPEDWDEVQKAREQRSDSYLYIEGSGFMLQAMLDAVSGTAEHEQREIFRQWLAKAVNASKDREGSVWWAGELSINGEFEEAA